MAISKINSFCDSIKSYSSSYKKIILDEIQNSKNRVEVAMSERKLEGTINIYGKNEEEWKRWFEEKRIYESKVKAWEEECRKYRALRNEILEIRLMSL